jgi:hypothetical protein
MWVDNFPLVQFLLAALPGIGLGWGLRWLVHRAALKRDGEVESRYERLTNMLGTFSQSLAVGLALTFLAALVAASRLDDPRLLAGLTFLCGVLTGFLAAFLKELFRRLSNTDF